MNNRILVRIILSLLQPKCEVLCGTCARVSTGGMIPPGADAVVQVEDTRIHCSKNVRCEHYTLIEYLLF